MQEDLQYIRKRLDHVVDRLSSQDRILERNTTSLEYHILRTDQNEEMIEKLSEQMEVALLPIKSAKWLGIVLGLLGTVFGAIISVRQFLGL